MEEGGTWFQERNGRKVLKLKLGSSGCQKYWRAPRPRPRPHRRRRRRQAKKIVQAALGHQEAASAVPAAEAEMVILVLQKSLRSALHRAAAAENQVGKPPGELGIRIPTEPPPVTTEQHTVGLRQHPSGLSSGQGKQPITTRRTRGDSGDFDMAGVPQAARDHADHRVPNHQPAPVTNQDPTAQVEQLKTQLTDLHVQLGDKERGLQEQEQAYCDIRRDYRDIRRDYRDIRRECCTLACELEDQEAANDALKESLAARLAATSRAVESLCAKVHIKLDTFEDTYDEMSPRELSRAFEKLHDCIMTRCDSLCLSLSSSRYRGEMSSSDLRL